MPNGNQGNLNQGVNYMDQSQQPVQNAMPQQPMVQPGVAPQQPVANTVPTGVNTLVEKLKTNKALLVGVIAGAVVLLVVIVFFASKLLNPSYNVVNKYMSGMKGFNAEKIAKLYHENYVEQEYDGDLGDLKDELEDSFESMEDEDYKITGYKIRECETYSEDELEDLADTLEEYYDIDEDDVKAAKDYYVRVNVDEDDEKNINYNSVTVVKIKNKWYLFN